MRNMAFRVVSYNVLADCYVRVPEQPWNAFSYCSDEHVAFTDRCPRIINNLIQSNADIIVLQEVMFEFRDDLWQLPEYLTSALHEHGFVCVMQGLKQKEIAKNALRNEKSVGRAIPTGLAICWKSEKFTEFDESKSGSGSGMTAFLQFRDDNNSSSGAVICVNTVHLIGSPSKFDQHLKQLEGVKKQLENGKVTESVTNGSSTCVFDFICGDFNTDVESNGLAFDSRDCQRTVVGEWLHDNNFQRAPTGVSWASDSSSSRLDHIMFRCRQQQQLKEVQGVMPEQSLKSWISCVEHQCFPEVKEEMDASMVGGLPNQYHPSDHVMLQADFCVDVHVAPQCYGPA